MRMDDVLSSLKHLQEISDKTQKDAARSANISASAVNYWLSKTHPPTIDKLDAYVRGLDGELIVEMWHPKEDRWPTVTTREGAEAAMLFEHLDAGERNTLLRLMRILPAAGKHTGTVKGMVKDIEDMLDALERKRA